MSGIEILPVLSRSDMRDFIDLPWKIYRHAPNWVPPLKKEVRKLLDTAKHPFWKFSECALYLAKRGSETVGRIAAIVDNNYNEFHGEKMGAWGFFECENDQEAAHALFAAAEKWVSDKGMTFFRGPLNPSTNYDVAMLIEGFDLPPTIMMPYNLPYYRDLAESYGFEKEKDLLTFHHSRGKTDRTERVARLAARIKRKKEVSIRPVNPKRLDLEVPLVKEIYDDAWSGNFGFVPMTEEELTEAAHGMRSIADPDLWFFVYNGSQLVGLCIVLPDINPLLQRLNGKIGILGLLKILRYKKEVTGLRGMLFGFKAEYQKQGFPLVAYDHVNSIFFDNDKGYEYMEFGWTLEDNDAINQMCIEMGGKLSKKYRIFRKSL